MITLHFIAPGPFTTTFCEHARFPTQFSQRYISLCRACHGRRTCYPLCPYECSHVYLVTVNSLCPLQIREREKFNCIPLHSPFTRHPHRPVCLGCLLTDIQRSRVGYGPHINSRSSGTLIEDGRSRYLNYHHSIISSPIAPRRGNNRPRRTQAVLVQDLCQYSPQ